MSHGPFARPAQAPRWTLTRTFALLAVALSLLTILYGRTLQLLEYHERGLLAVTLDDALSRWLIQDATRLLLAFVGVWLVVRSCQERWGVSGAQRLSSMLAVFVALAMVTPYLLGWLSATYGASLYADADADVHSRLLVMTLYHHAYSLLTYGLGMLLAAWLSLRLFRGALLPGEPPALSARQVAWAAALLYLGMLLKLQGAMLDLAFLDHRLPALGQLGLLVLLPVLLESAVVFAAVLDQLRVPLARLAPGRLLSGMALLLVLRTLVVLALAFVYTQQGEDLGLLMKLALLGLILLWPLTVACLRVVYGAPKAAGHPVNRLPRFR